MQIQNKIELVRHHGHFESFNICMSALEAALQSVDPYELVKKSVLIKKNVKKIKRETAKNEDNNLLIIKDVNSKEFRFNLTAFDSIHAVGAGKATARMAIAIQDILDEKNINLDSGAINVPYKEKSRPKKIKVTLASHPVPDENSIRGTKTIIDLLGKIKDKPLVFVLISGGASSLLCYPIDGLDLKSKQEITQMLLKSGASIHEINIIRKHLSKVKGGNLVRYPNHNATLVTLILSDVVGDDLNIIGSGPTVGDDSTFNEAIEILKKYKLWDSIEKKTNTRKIRNILEKGSLGLIQEVPRKQDPIFKKVTNILIGNNEIACRAAVSDIRKYGVKPIYLGSQFVSEAKIFGKELANILLNSKINDNVLKGYKQIVGYRKSKADIAAFVLGGETVVKIESPDSKAEKDFTGIDQKSKKEYILTGIGGRNQESILAASQDLKSTNLSDFTILCCGTDGIDGNSDFAGGIITPVTIDFINIKKIDLDKYLQFHDSSSYLKKVKSFIKTGRTGTNVNDISIICRIR
jgi:glycerate-2-kinase